MFDKLHEECGVFGIFGHSEAANLAYLGLYALQHRGQESAGIATADGAQASPAPRHGVRRRRVRRDRARPPCRATRPSGTSATRRRATATTDNAQPLLIDCAHGQVAICHNGNLVNAGEIRNELVRQGSIFQTTSDTEVILHLYARSQATHRRGGHRRVAGPGDRRVLAGVLTADRLIAARDPHGFRPLWRSGASGDG